MIKSFFIKNIQSHQQTEANDLHEGVNIIKGDSGTGKSTLRRSLKWVIRNTPRGFGDNYKSNFADDKEETSCEIVFDNGSVKRIKKGILNQLQLKTKDKEITLEAIGSDIPEELSALTNMSEINIQDQHSSFFLLQDTPRDRGKKLNELLGLEIIHRSINKVHKIVTNAKREKERIGNEIKEKKEELKEFADLSEMEAILVKVEKDFEKTEEMEKENGRLNYVLDSLGVEEDNIEYLTKKIQLKPEVIGLIRTIEEFKQATRENRNLTPLLERIQQDEEIIVRFRKKIEYKIPLMELRESAKEVGEKEDALVKLNGILFAITQEETNITELREKITNTKEKRKKLLEENKDVFCDKCGSYISHWRRK